MLPLVSLRLSVSINSSLIASTIFHAGLRAAISKALMMFAMWILSLNTFHDRLNDSDASSGSNLNIFFGIEHGNEKTG